MCNFSWVKGADSQGSRVAIPQQDCANLKSRAPLVLQDVKTYPSQLVNIWVVYLCQEAHLLYKAKLKFVTGYN